MNRSYFSKARMTLTKTDMARVVIAALYHYPDYDLPSADDGRVKRTVRRHNTEEVRDLHTLALAAMASDREG